MKNIVYGFIIVLFCAASVSALTIENQHGNKVKFEIKLYINKEKSNDIYKSLLPNDKIAMPGIFSEYPGTLFSIIVFDYDYSRTRVVCVDRIARDEGTKIVYLGGGKCQVKVKSLSQNRTF